MKRPRLQVLVTALFMTTTAVIAFAQEPVTADLGIDRTALPVPVDGFDDVTGGVFRDGRIYLSGQPSPAPGDSSEGI